MFTSVSEELAGKLAAIRDASVAAAMIPLTQQVAEYGPTSLGGAEGLPWHATLSQDATVTDCLDCATNADGLYAVPNFEGPMELMKDSLESVKVAWKVFDIKEDKALAQQVNKVMQQMCVTRAEQHLATLFSAAGWDKYTATEREHKVRQIRSFVGGPRKFLQVFKPLREKALETLKGK